MTHAPGIHAAASARALGADPQSGMARPPRSTMSDDDRRRALRRMRGFALSLLVVAAIVFLLTHGHGGAWGFVNAAAEASMVGGLADWFAVTALFRHPLGIPVPHTAIIPTRKDALGRSLEDFVSTNFLAESVVRSRVETAELSRRLGQWLEDTAHSTRVVDEAARLVRHALTAIKDTDVASLVSQTLIPRLDREQVSPILGRLLHEVVRDGAHHGLVDLTVNEAHRWLSEHEESVTAAFTVRAPWWTPTWLDDRVTRRVHKEIVAWITGVRDDPDHPARKSLDDLLSRLADDLQNDPDTMAKAEALKTRLLTSPQTEQSIASLWNAVRRALVEAVDEPDGLLRERGRDALAQFGVRLGSDAELRARLDGYAADAVGYIVRSYGPELATVISDTINRWDGKEAATRIELYIGRDLQFIRINGTVVGGLVGIAIHALTLVL